MKGRKIYFLPFFLLLSLFSPDLYAQQPTWTIDPFGREKKPEQYEEKKLGSEKTADKKFTTVRRIVQNNITHYNFYFNANNKLNAVLERAKLAHKEDYSKLLSFYPYSLDNTASQQVELDSVIYKSTGGILLHDLRSDWVDNMYLLIGKAYYYRKEFDSAAFTFQFINYNLFPRKKQEEDSRVVGTNVVNENETPTALSIANKEKRNVVQKVLTLPPSRNDALIWLARTYTDQEQYGDAAGMINILQNDPNLPKRLRNDLDEVTAYWFFKQNSFDSAAVYLEKGLSNADDRADKSRWQYLLAQMYENSGSYDKASEYYSKAAKYTVDPVMDIFARLNNAKMLRNSGNVKELDESIATLIKMARKDKYESYRDIIYHSAGLLSLQKPDTTQGIGLFSKSLVYNTANEPFKNKAHLQLGKIAYQQRQYKKAADHYDSLNISEPTILEDSAAIADRKVVLRKIVVQLDIIEKEDSLQMIALMPAAERDAFLKKLVKKFRKEKGLKDEDNFAGNTLITSFGKDKEAPIDLFETASKGEWYFYNNNMKSRGYNEFKAKWGKRDNADNWRRKSAIDGSKSLNANIDIDAPSTSDPLSGDGDAAAGGKPVANSYDALLGDLPLTPELLDSSNARIAGALIELAKLFEYELQDYQQAIYTYDIYLQRYPDKLANGEVYLGLYHCYQKLGDAVKAAYYKNLLESQFADSKFSKMITDPASLQPEKNNPAVAAQYEAIYNMFIEGNFEKALSEKSKADSLYGNHYWTPQLLYIEAVQYIRNREDSQAILTLTNIASFYPQSALKDKALTMVEVLKRRSEIETYLSNLEVTRLPEDDKIIMPSDKPVEAPKPVVTAPVTRRIEPVRNIPVPKDSSIQLPPSMVSGGFKWQPAKPHHVIMILDKVDAVYVNEAKNAFARFNREKYFSKVVINKDVLDAQRSLLVFTSFENATDAITYFDLVKKAAPSEVSWLQAAKYSFLVISEENLQLLKTNKDIITYKGLLNTQYPGKF